MTYNTHVKQILAQGVTLLELKESKLNQAEQAGYWIANHKGVVSGVLRILVSGEQKTHAGYCPNDAYYFQLDPTTDKDPVMLGESDWERYVTNGKANLGPAIEDIQRSKGNRHTLKTKQEAIELAGRGVKQSYIANKFGINSRTIRRWIAGATTQ